jgi:hypothetical protein
VLANCDVPFLIIVHVVGCGSTLKSVAQEMGIPDDRIVFSGDSYDSSSFRGMSYWPKPNDKPFGIYSSTRFLYLDKLVSLLNLPVFICDIDTILQQGVSDLLALHVDSDIVFNENTASQQPGDRLTANLILVRPNENARLFIGFLKNYLIKELAKPVVAAFVDQIGLQLSLQHMVKYGSDVQVSYFDTTRDINNAMYSHFEKNPFRFFSLFHSGGFDMTTLDEDTYV